jgi:hypothetical protein
MGYESDYLIVSILGIEEEFVAAMGPSLDECNSFDVISRADGIKYLIPKVRRKTYGGSIGLR